MSPIQQSSSSPLSLQDVASNHESTITQVEEDNTEKMLREPLLLNDSTTRLQQREDNDEERQQTLQRTSNDDDVEPNDDESSTPSFRGLLFFRFMYFLGGLSASTWGRFGIIYYNEVKHLSPEQIGTLQGVMPLFGFVTMPFWGYMADLIKSRKRIYLLCTVMNCIFLLSLSLDIIDSFPTILLCVSGMAIFRSSGVLDSHALDFLGDKHRGMYGTIRLWTAISWGLGAVIMGWITDNYGFKWNFVLFGSMMILKFFVTACGLPARSKSEQARYDLGNNHHSSNTNHLIDSNVVSNTLEEARDDENTNQTHHHSRPRPRILFQALCRIPVFFWLFEVALIGAGMSLVDSFLFVFLQNNLDASTKLCGYTVGITVIFELPIFHYSQYLLKKLGHDILFMLAMVAYIIRVFGYTWITPSSVHSILLLEILHGITFACMWIASVDFSATVAPEEWSTTVQTILSMIMTCLGGGVGPIIGGWIMEHYGPIVMYRGSGWILGIVLIIHSIAFLVFKVGHDSFLHSISSTTATRAAAAAAQNEQEHSHSSEDVTDGNNQSQLVSTRNPSCDEEEEQ